MEFDLAALAPADRYKLLASVIVPRPIAWVTTMSAAGRVNAAPFSFFNLLGSDPPVVALGISDNGGPNAAPKDTARNIADTGEFVINLVTRDLTEAMNVSAVAFGPEEDELALAGLVPAPSVLVRPPRIAASPVSLECRLAQIITLGANRIVLGQGVHLHITDDAVDSATRRVNTPALGLIGRMHGGGGYVDTSGAAGALFDLPRLTRAAWDAARRVGRRAPRSGNVAGT